MAKTNNETSEFVNPFEPAKVVVRNGANVVIPGPSIDQFVAALSGKSVKEYLDGQFKTETEPFTDEDVKWLESEIKKAAYNAAHKDEFLTTANAEHRALIMKDNKKVNE
jgi:hypothetical protein